MSRIFKWIGFVLTGCVLLGVVGCSTVGLPRVNSNPEKLTAKPDLLAPIGGMDEVTDIQSWEEERAPFWMDILLSQVYGSIPPKSELSIVSDEILQTDLLDGAASLRAVRLKLSISGRDFIQDVHFVIPNTKGPHPVILGAGSCPNTVTLPFEGVTVPDGILWPGYCDAKGYKEALSHFIFGRYIETPPLEELVAHGYAFGAYYPGMVVPDSPQAALSILSDLNGDAESLEHGPYAAIGIWGWVASQITDYIETEPSLDAERVILFGHSRSGKSSLLAGALDKRIAGVIAHQSGTGGASLQKNDVGESIDEITNTYPHWFTPNYALYAENNAAMPFDQHALVAQMAPRFLLLGNSARDQWSDPQGAFASAKAAGQVYELYGLTGFEAENLADFRPDAPLSFQFREGTHGITPEDWHPFLRWLVAHFAAE